MNLPHPQAGTLRRLDLAWVHRLTLVLGPACAGKTSLLRLWRNELSGPVAWLSLQDEDNDLEHFTRVLLATFRESHLTGAEIELPAPGTLQITEWEDLKVEVLNGLAEAPADFMLVLDGFDIVRSASVADLVEYLVEYGPPQMHTIIVARTEPALPLARLRVRRQLLTIEMHPHGAPASRRAFRALKGRKFCVTDRPLVARAQRKRKTRST